MRLTHPIRLGLGALVVAAMIWQGQNAVRSAEWYLESKVQMQGNYDDNIRLEADDEVEAVGAVVSPEVKLGRRNETLDLSLMGRVDASAFASEQDLDSVDERVIFNATRKSQRGKLGFNADFNRDTTLTTEESDTGNLTETARVETLTVSPTWSYQLSPLDTLDLNGAYTNTSYDTDELTDFEFLTAGASWSRAIGPMDMLLGGVFAARFEADDATNTASDIFGAQVGWSHQFSDNIRVQGVAGLEHVTTRFDGPTGRDSDDTLGYRLDLSLSYAFDDVTKLELSGSRKTEPSGGGTVVTRNRAQVSLTRRLSPMLTFRTDGSYIASEQDERSGLDQRTFFAVQPSLTWSLDRDWDLSASYRFRTQEFESGESASSNAAFLTLTYRLPRQSWSE